MSESVGSGEPGAICGPVSAAVTDLLDRLAAVDAELAELTPAGMCVADLRAVAKGIEAHLTRGRQVQRAAFGELDRRGVLTSLQLRRLSDFIAAELRCSRAAARAHSSAIDRFAPRRALTGEPLEPVFPVAADALSAGEINDEHANVIATVVESLPDRTRAERGPEVETTLTSLAREKDPRALKLLADRIIAHLDPDGPEPTEQAERAQHAGRRLVFGRYGDSAGHLGGDLTPACAELWRAILTPLAQPRPADADGPDTRTDAQRLHDAFEEAGRRLLAAGNLPSNAGLATSLIITIDLTDLENRIGRATTHHGGTLTVNEALRVATDGRLIPAVFGDSGEILTLGRSQRLASPAQRRALFARDRGCSFPDCPRTAAESEIHHAPDWIYGGTTDVDSMTVVCGYHNNEAPRMGWRTVMIDGIPHWRPPRWRDPDQRLQRNCLHHPELVRHDLIPSQGRLTQPDLKDPGQPLR